ncbi:beta-lactamase family protein [Streptomyces sp. NBC_01465]|nr:serine hydrolase domain-containing protein [Streptomyces sp. NBC_01465]
MLAASLLGAAASATSPEPGPSPSTTALSRLVSAGTAPAAALLSQSPSTGSRFVTTGPAVRRTDHFRAGSITKTFVATVVLQLAAEHKLRLSDTVESHLPNLVRGHGNDGRRITLRALLSHTAGLYDYTHSTAARASAPRTPLAALHTALAHSPTRIGSYAYSNTDYVLLGLVVHQVTGRSYAAEVTRRILTPLHLTGTSFPGARRTLPSPYGRSYSLSAPGRDATTLVDPRTAGAAGELISTLADLNHFYSALLGGRLLPAPALADLLNTTPAQGRYGLGVFPQRLSCGRTVWGHNGRITGSYVRTATTGDGRHTVTFRLNSDTEPAPSLERAVLEAEFCP